MEAKESLTEKAGTLDIKQIRGPAWALQCERATGAGQEREEEAGERSGLKGWGEGRESQRWSRFLFRHIQSCHFNGFCRRRQACFPGSLGNQLPMREEFLKSPLFKKSILSYCFRAFFFLICINYASDFF